MTNTSMAEVSAAELKVLDPRRFDREYSRWAEWQWEDDWYTENAKERFSEQYKANGIKIDDLHYSISYSQGDYASFSGRIFVSYWMETVQTCPDGPTYAERYPALYLACREDGTYVRVRGQDGRRAMYPEWEESWAHVGPQGIFAGMDEAEWEELVEEQAKEAELDDEIRRYCKAIDRELYDHLRDSYEDATSEEEFLASCEANNVTFEIEVEDEVHI